MTANYCTIFVFQDLLYLSDRDVATVMKEVDNPTFLIACQGCSESVVWRIVSTFSETARAYFYEDINQFCNSSREEVDEARWKIQSIMDELFYNGEFLDCNLKLSA